MWVNIFMIFIEGTPNVKFLIAHGDGGAISGNVISDLSCELQSIYHWKKQVRVLL